jgi:predicted porin
MNDDLTVFLKIELDGITADDKTTSRSSSTIQLDEAYIGIEGSSFGRLWIGSDDSIMEQKTQSIANHWEIGILNIGRNGTTGEGDLIQYVSPSMNGFSVFGAIQFKSDNDAVDYESDNPFQLGGSYSAGALTVNVAMDSNDGVAKGTNDEDSYALRAEYAMNNWSVAAEFETRDDHSDRFGLMGKYSMGQTSFALAYELATDESPTETGGEFSVVSIQVLQNISSNAYVYVEAYFATAEDDLVADIDTDQFGIGAVYYF